MAKNTIQISVKGKWVRIPCIDVEGNSLVVKGRALKVASIHDEAWLETEVKDPGACVRKLKERGADVLPADVFTFAQKLPDTVAKYDYPTEWESMAAIRLSTFKEWWGRVPQETRKNVRRSEKRGVVVQVKCFDETLIRGIREVNNDSNERQGMRNTYYGKSLEQLKRDYSSFVDRSDFICAYFKDEMVGFLKLVHRGNVAAILNLTVKPSHSDKRPANALIAKAVELAEGHGAHFVTYGYFNYGNKRESSLREFKARNGFEEILVPRFYVPLTAWGKLCLMLKLHRGLLGILPTSVIALGLGARAKWRDLTLWMSRCSSMLERSNRNRQMECSNPPAGSNS